jgi:hypothetical protein
MDTKKTIQDYEIGSHNNKISVNVPEYMLSSEGLIKLMRISGYWEYNSEVIQNLDIQN